MHNHILSLSLFFLGPHVRHMEVPRLGVESELQMPAYATATATRDLSHVCDLHHSSQQSRILNPLSKAKDWTRNLMVGFISAVPRQELLFVCFLIWSIWKSFLKVVLCLEGQCLCKRSKTLSLYRHWIPAMDICPHQTSLLPMPTKGVLWKFPLWLSGNEPD